MNVKINDDRSYNVFSENKLVKKGKKCGSRNHVVMLQNNISKLLNLLMKAL